MKLKLVVILLVIFALNIDKCLAAFRSFHRGRRYQILSVADLPLTTNIAEKFFEQRLDHFNEANKQTWKQRYWVNGNFFSKNGPVFLMIGGEGTLYSTSMVKGQWINYAKKFKALCVMLEHRYYGKSQPTSDMSTENLIYLNSEQALADLASFRNFIHRSYNLTAANKWVSFGGSYSGSLSAWLRLKYPHLIHASVSSSGPLLALIDFHKYLDVVNNSLAMYSPQCPNRVEIGMRQIQRLEATKDGRSKLDKLFKTCDNLQDDNDVTNFNSIIVGYFQEVVQYNIYGASFGIQQTCDIMMNTSLGEEINRLVVINQHFLDQSNEKCLDASNRKWIERLKNSTWDDTQTAYRQWTYQTCTEFGFFQSTDSNNQPFGQTIPLKYYIDQCQDVFGANFSMGLLESAITDTNLNYGGLEYGGTRVVFVHGNVDPWHSLGIVKVAPNLLTHAILINGTSHCADMRENANYDSLELKRAREKVAYFISNWLH